MGLIKTATRVAVASSVHGRVQRRQQQRWAGQDQSQHVPPPLPTPAADQAALPSPPVSTADKIAQLKTLGELKDSGVLTDFEFETEKRKLLQG